ncbi:hypothetical protein OQA88_11586 [Cercophora sp. LCS_1]
MASSSGLESLPKRCGACDVSFESDNARRVHSKTSWHVENIRRRVAGLPPTDAATAGKPTVPTTERRAKRRSRYPETSTDDDTETESISDEDGTVEAVAFVKEQCLFCNQISCSFDENMQHMQKCHGLFIAKRDRLVVSIEALVEYLHLVIFAYHECLWCHSRRSTVEATQQHMVGKGHCRLDVHKVDSEYRDFFDLATTGSDGADVPISQPVGSDAEVSLTLPSGRIVGGRSSRRGQGAGRQSQSPRVKANKELQRLDGGLGGVFDPVDPGSDRHLVGQQQKGADGLALQQLRAGDRATMMQLAPSEYRAVIATQRKEQGNAQRAELRREARVHMQGNKTLMEHFISDIPARRLRYILTLRQPLHSTTTMPSTQELLASFYDIDNVITINVTMAAGDWKKLLGAQPKGGAPRLTTFTTVGIIKKSFTGSFSTTKPSIRLDFSRFNEAQEGRIEKPLKTLTLNNSKQDQSFVRQIVGYEIIRQVGLPYPRCNYARVFVNGTDYGIYVNVEPFKKAFIRRNFSNNDKGNLYELEHAEDLAIETLDKGRISFEGFSKFGNLADLRKAVEKLRRGFPTASQVVDMDIFIRFQAIEALFKHWDGYGIQRNNTYVHPSGIDQIFQEDRDFIVGALGRVSGLVINDNAAKNKLRDTIRQFGDNVFGTANLENTIFPLMNRLGKILRDNGASSKQPEEIAKLHKKLAIVRSGAYQLFDEFPASGAPWISMTSGTALGVDSSTSMGPAAGAFDAAHGSGT